MTARRPAADAGPWRAEDGMGTMTSLRLGSLFAGVGGFDLGFERAGIQPVWAVEIDPACQRVLRHHWPGLHIESDVREVGAHNLEPVDVITFGSPCQDLSVAGKRGGFAGERSGLYFEAIRIIRELRPTFAVWENVPGALSSHAGRDFGRALDELADSGALDIGWAVLDAQWFGVAQRRRRVFVVADFGGQRAAEILALADGLSGHPAPRRETREGATAGTAPSLTASGRGVERAGESRGPDPVIPFDLTQLTSVANRQRLEAGTPARTLHAAGGAHVITHALTGEGHDASEDGTGRGTPLTVYQCHGTSVGPMGTLRQGNGDVTGGVPFMAFTDVTGPLVDSGGQRGWSSSVDSPNFVAAPNMAVRRLTPTECERLMGFPDGHTAVDGAADSTRYRQLGNSVVVNVTEWLGRRIVAAATGPAAMTLGEG